MDMAATTMANPPARAAVDLRAGFDLHELDEHPLITRLLNWASEYWPREWLMGFFAGSCSRLCPCHTTV